MKKKPISVTVLTVQHFAIASMFLCCQDISRPLLLALKHFNPEILNAKLERKTVSSSTIPFVSVNKIMRRLL